MDYSKTPLWMQDDLVKDIPREKLDFLSKLFAQGHGKSQKEMMALLMPAMRKAKQEHLTFTLFRKSKMALVRFSGRRSCYSGCCRFHR